MRLLRRVLAGVVVLLVLMALGVGGLLWWSLPPRGLQAAVPGLSAPVHIGLDENDIPRITAANALDGAAALGFLHARDRMFQMEMMRRAASGRLAEVVGRMALRSDRTMRILGLRRRAEADLGQLDADTRAMLEAYAKGVNAWIALRGRFAAPELIPFGAPEPWTPVDSLLWGKTMALYLSTNWRQELARAALLPRLTPDQIRALWPAQEKTPSPAADLGAAATRLAALVPAFPEPFTQPSSASNEWAESGAHTTTGAPLLAGDPHLGFSMPSVWYLARIQTPQGVLAGATAPGVPFMIIGHNGHIAWTFTTTGADTQDVFVETPFDADSYATPDGPRPFTRRQETIHVLGGADEVVTVRETRHGPVLSDLDAAGGPVMAVAMANLEPGDTAASGLLALNRAATAQEAGRTAAMITAPVQNLLVADRNHIGMFTTGRIPIRRSGDGTLPVGGADGAHDWTGFASGEELPHQFDPPSGRLVNANERTAPPDFPVFMGQDWFGDWRAQRIRALLDERSTTTVVYYAQMQVDPISTFALSVLPRLQRTEPLDRASRSALSLLRHWDGSMRMDRPHALLFNDWMRRFEAAVLARQGVEPGMEGPTSDMVARALGPGESTWCGADCGALLSRSLSEAASWIDVDSRWGDLHVVEFAHPLLGRIPLIGRLFTWQIEQPGDDTTIFRGTPHGPQFTSVHGAEFRGVFDLADLERSQFALTPGQSGHFLRAQAGSLMGSWRSGTTLKLGPQAKEDDMIDLHP